MDEERVEKEPCTWRTSDGRCANCKARRYRLDALGMNDSYGECRGQKDYHACDFYRNEPFLRPEKEPVPEVSELVDIDLDGMLKGLRSLAVEECRAALEETRELLTSGLADRRLLLALLTLTSAEDDQVRRDASWCIGKLALMKLGDPRSVGMLVSLTADYDPEVRANAAWALGELTGLDIGDTVSIEALNILLTDECTEARGMAAWALGRMANKMRVTSPCSVPLLKVMHLNRSEHLRKGAEWSLERIERIIP